MSVCLYVRQAKKMMSYIAGHIHLFVRVPACAATFPIKLSYSSKVLFVDFGLKTLHHISREFEVQL